MWWSVRNDRRVRRKVVRKPQSFVYEFRLLSAPSAVKWRDARGRLRFESWYFPQRRRRYARLKLNVKGNGLCFAWSRANLRNREYTFASRILSPLKPLSYPSPRCSSLENMKEKKQFVFYFRNGKVNKILVLYGSAIVVWTGIIGLNQNCGVTICCSISRTIAALK